MTGDPTNPPLWGVTPRAIHELFDVAQTMSVKAEVTVSAYFVELYNDALVDLFYLLDHGSRGTPPKLDIKVDAKKMVHLRNSVIKEAHTAEELLDLFERGNRERHVGATKMNAESSRSHSIFSILISSRDRATGKISNGKLSLIDLAGSERADKTGATGDRLKEAQSINLSLSALGDVINALSQNEKFIPYRNNKLTQLMQVQIEANF